MWDRLTTCLDYVCPSQADGITTEITYDCYSESLKSTSYAYVDWQFWGACVTARTV